MMNTITYLQDNITAKKLEVEALQEKLFAAKRELEAMEWQYKNTLYPWRARCIDGNEHFADEIKFADSKEAAIQSAMMLVAQWQSYPKSCRVEQISDVEWIHHDLKNPHLPPHRLIVEENPLYISLRE